MLADLLSEYFLQTTGGPSVLVVLSLLGLLVTAVLSLAVAYLVARGYRNNRGRARLYLAIGLVLLVTGPIIIQFVLTNLTDISAVGRRPRIRASSSDSPPRCTRSTAFRTAASPTSRHDRGEEG